MLRPAHRRALRLSHSSVSGDPFDLDRPGRPISLDDVFADVDARLAEL